MPYSPLLSIPFFNFYSFVVFKTEDYDPCLLNIMHKLKLIVLIPVIKHMHKT